jgi:hypothetical protein
MGSRFVRLLKLVLTHITRVQTVAVGGSFPSLFISVAQHEQCDDQISACMVFPPRVELSTWK